MLVDALLPQLLSIGRVKSVEGANLIAEQQHIAAAFAHRQDRRAHRTRRFIQPAHAAGFAVERMDHAARAAHEQLIIENGRLREGGKIAIESKGPLEFQTLHRIERQTGGVRGLIAPVVSTRAPPVPLNLGIRRNLHGAVAAESHRGRRRFPARCTDVLGHRLALRESHGVSHLHHRAVIQGPQDARRGQFFQGLARRNARIIGFVAASAALLKDGLTRRSLRGQGRRRA